MFGQRLRNRLQHTPAYACRGTNAPQMRVELATRCQTMTPRPDTREQSSVIASTARLAYFTLDLLTVLDYK